MCADHALYCRETEKLPPIYKLLDVLFYGALIFMVVVIAASPIVFQAPAASYQAVAFTATTDKHHVEATIHGDLNAPLVHEGDLYVIEGDENAMTVSQP